MRGASWGRGQLGQGLAGTSISLVPLHSLSSGMLPASSRHSTLRRVRSERHAAVTSARLPVAHGRLLADARKRASVPGPDLLGALDATREREPEVHAEQLVELELAVLFVELVVGEATVGCATVGVEAARVPSEGESSPLEAEVDEVPHVERQAEPKGRGHCRTRNAIEIEAVGFAILALFQPDHRSPREEVGVGVDEDLLKDGELAAERNDRNLRRNDPIDGTKLVLEIA